MANGTPGNVELGPGWLYVAVLGTTEPTSATAALPSAWRPVGYTEDGNVFTSGTTSEAVEVAEELDPIFYANTKRESRLEFSMAEVVRHNLALALNIGPSEANDATAIEPPDLGTEVRCMIVWDFYAAGDSLFATLNRRFLGRQAYQSGDLAIPRRKAPNKSLLPVNFRLEKPATGSKVWKFWPTPTGLL